MRLSRLKAFGGFFLAAILSAPAWGANSPQPGTVNYFEGQVRIGSSALNSQRIGSTRLHRGQSLVTGKGKAELLLTPGVFLRVDDHSSVKMLSPGLANTKVRLTNGQAMAEVDEIYKENNIRVLEDGASIRLLKTGLYDFDARQGQIRVFKGQALVREGDQHIKAGGGHDVSLIAGGRLRSRKFDKKADEGSLYRFSKLRSDYLAKATTKPQAYASNYGWYGSGWYGAGWVWDPWLDAFTFIPPGGVLYNPFGFGFYPTFGFGEPFFFRHHFGRFPDFDEHPNFAFHHGFPDEDRPGRPPFRGVRPFPKFEPHEGGPRQAFHPPLPAVPHVRGFARGPAMGVVHPPEGHAFAGRGFRGGDFDHDFRH